MEMYNKNLPHYFVAEFIDLNGEKLETKKCIYDFALCGELQKLNALKLIRIKVVQSNLEIQYAPNSKIAKQVKFITEQLNKALFNK